MNELELIPPSLDWVCSQCGETGNLSALEEMRLEIDKKYVKICPECGSRVKISFSALERIFTKM